MSGATIFRATIAAAVLAAAFAFPGEGRVSDQPYQPDQRLSTPLFAAVAIPHDAQRYDTVGDWDQTPTTTSLRISRLSDRRFEILIAVHELIEAEICRQRGIKQEAITEFDKAFEAKRQAELARLERHLGQLMTRAHTRQQVSATKADIKKWQEAEPGDDPAAPYREEHQFAYRIEKLLARELGVDWKAYEDEIVSLEWRKPAHE